MYVKVVFKDKGREESIYECDMVHFPAHEEFVIIEREGEPEELHFYGAGHIVVYVMSDKGQTIDKRNFVSCDQPDLG